MSHSCNNSREVIGRLMEEIRRPDLRYSPHDLYQVYCQVSEHVACTDDPKTIHNIVVRRIKNREGADETFCFQNGKRLF